MQGKRAKTDRVDARLLASLGESQQPEATPPPEEDQEGLKAMHRHLEWLGKELRAARNRQETAAFSPWTPKEVLDSLGRTIQQLEQEIALVREAMASHQEQNQEWTRQMNLLTSIPGVGERTATLLLAEMPPVARCPSARTWAAFCGLNPEPRQSGKSTYSRLSRKGTPRGTGRTVSAGGERPALESGGQSIGRPAAGAWQNRSEYASWQPCTSCCVFVSVSSRAEGPLICLCISLS